MCLGESTPDEPLTYPCHCPRPVHAPCLARWQLHSAGSRCGAQGFSETAALAQPRVPVGLLRLRSVGAPGPAWLHARAQAALAPVSLQAPGGPALQALWHVEGIPPHQRRPCFHDMMPGANR